MVFAYEKEFAASLVRLTRKWLRENKKSKFGTPSYMVVSEIKDILEGAIAYFIKFQEQGKQE